MKTTTYDKVNEKVCTKKKKKKNLTSCYTRLYNFTIIYPSSLLLPRPLLSERKPHHTTTTTLHAGRVGKTRAVVVVNFTVILYSVGLQFPRRAVARVGITWPPASRRPRDYVNVCNAYGHVEVRAAHVYNNRTSVTGDRKGPIRAAVAATCNTRLGSIGSVACRRQKKHTIARRLRDIKTE